MCHYLAASNIIQQNITSRLPITLISFTQQLCQMQPLTAKLVTAEQGYWVSSSLVADFIASITLRVWMNSTCLKSAHCRNRVPFRLLSSSRDIGAVMLKDNSANLSFIYYSYNQSSNNIDYSSDHVTHKILWAILKNMILKEHSLWVVNSSKMEVRKCRCTQWYINTNNSLKKNTHNEAKCDI